MAPAVAQVLKPALRFLGRRVVPAVIVIRLIRTPLLHGLQTWIAKGRKEYKRQALEGNYGPVDQEVYQHATVVDGHIPDGLEGVYLRNGPNPAQPVAASIHWFEGDGMIHATTISKGQQVMYCNRYVVTSRLLQERKAGKAIFAKFGDQEGVRGLFVALLELLKAKLGVINMKQGNGTANTALVYHAGRIMALHEGDLPYQVRVHSNGKIETVGRMKIGSGRDAWTMPFTAHPKLDPDTGCLHFIGYNIDKKPFLRYGILSPEGELQHSLVIDLPYPTMLHDFAITRNFALFLHLPLCFDPQAMIKQNSLPIVYKPNFSARIGLMPLRAKSAKEVKWFELPSFMAFHVANAWEESNTVRLMCCVSKGMDMGATEFTEDMGARMTEITLDISSGTASMRTLSDVLCDFPVVHPGLIGRRTRYSWAASFSAKDRQARIDGIAKIDLLANPAPEPAAFSTTAAEAAAARTAGGSPRSPAKESAAVAGPPAGPLPTAPRDCCVSRIQFGPSQYGGEAFFVPRPGDLAKRNGDDDGWLLVYVFDIPLDTSFLHIYDAKTMSSTPLAKIRLPQRVPYGFHTTFISEQQLAKQVV
eukprot:CAMPEP_0202896940 /NCGR_PEP_ID=MMETSP1392-20130828/5832_1 /ASSEMBLY_ACC=CAM_ASM_000868 /TAXON_ID=225041 /ORGANISM="Chlamydomonas chlamydogama, Strain SAG 11-48b" /LENGTH=587 /DNA_ID=CAMNT_0049582459 /DNA_START=58 /DNA_END=1821 /DNA_ORIENTATION=-